ncbi:hypothetical protein NUW54_g8123 [Trametes sanguinea]|uniref:Uncharacterized protein n=1 Tax=Trametes sanguinea TaxID=158606 RepID=A0ACC1PHJ7_9APHY|nr:hypothetical protein NUW54_g8123 [Trametes sanguinea]
MIRKCKLISHYPLSAVCHRDSLACREYLVTGPQLSKQYCYIGSHEEVRKNGPSRSLAASQAYWVNLMMNCSGKAFLQRTLLRFFGGDKGAVQKRKSKRRRRSSSSASDEDRRSSRKKRKSGMSPQIMLYSTAPLTHILTALTESKRRKLVRGSLRRSPKLQVKSCQRSGSSPASKQRSSISSFKSYSESSTHSYESESFELESSSTTTSAASDSMPEVECHRPRSSTQKVNEGPPWDGWPNGDFEQTYLAEDLARTKQLQVHWACVTSGLSKGSVDAEQWANGRLSERRCQGVIQCDNPSCLVVIRPKVSHARISTQLAPPCACGGTLSRSDPPCPARAKLYKYKYGVHFIHSGTHNHPRPTHLLHLGREEEAEFRQLVTNHPKAGPLELSVGVRTLHGPGTPASSISPVFLNKDRVKHEQRKIKQEANPSSSIGDHFLAAFAQFCREHPGFVLQSVIGEVTVVSLQTPVLRRQLIKDALLSGPDSNVNGIVSDAAHGFWRDHSALLIISSTFSATLRCWVPGLFSYSNGATTEHYRLHFLALFRSMSQEARMRQITISDDLFANVVDFSEAERSGFIHAFIDFWHHEGTTRTSDDLRASAEQLLKGCQQHFRAGVTRLKRTGGIIQLDDAPKFERMAHSLLEVKALSEFQKHSAKLLSRFPNIAPWLEWWLRDSHAAMLFAPYRRMDVDLWASLPDTTNAEEAMHWKIYAGIGQDQTFLGGLVSLFAFAEHYERLLSGAAVGIPIRYGQPEPWKATAKRIGRTKPSRDPQMRKQGGHRYHNDGRPPDTQSSLRKGRKSQLKLTQKLNKRLGSSPLASHPHSSKKRKQSFSEDLDLPLRNQSGKHVTFSSDLTGVRQRRVSEAVSLSDKSILTLFSESRRDERGTSHDTAGMMTQMPAEASESDESRGHRSTSDSRVSRSPSPGLDSNPGSSSAVVATVPPVSPHLGRSFPCYSQSLNSCWLDVALQTIYAAVSNDFHSFEERILGALPVDHLLFKLYECLDLRRSAESGPGGQSSAAEHLNLQHDALRNVLANHPRQIIRTVDSMENAFAWLGEVLRLAMVEPASQFALTYFMGYYATLRSCTAATQPHYQVSATPRPVFYHQLTSSQNLQFDGSLAAWLKSKLQARPQAQTVRCWRSVRVENKGSLGSADFQGCESSGSVLDVYLSLPILLLIDLNQENGQEWDCPDRIVVAQKTSAGMPATVYHLVSRIFHSPAQLHYICRFRTSHLGTGRPLIYQYDSMASGGYAHEINGGKLSTHLAGRDTTLQLPGTSSSKQELYSLQKHIA